MESFVVRDDGLSLTGLARQARDTGALVVAEWGGRTYTIDGKCPACHKAFDTAFVDPETEDADVPLWLFHHVAARETCKSSLPLAES